eukprot:scaffold7409_cov350-Prasinococcus_capsulatus_cf.AAC.2
MNESTSEPTEGPRRIYSAEKGGEDHAGAKARDAEHFARAAAGLALPSFRGGGGRGVGRCGLMDLASAGAGHAREVARAAAVGAALLDLLLHVVDLDGHKGREHPDGAAGEGGHDGVHLRELGGQVHGLDEGGVGGAVEADVELRGGGHEAAHDDDEGHRARVEAVVVRHLGLVQVRQQRDRRPEGALLRQQLLFRQRQEHLRLALRDVAHDRRQVHVLVVRVHHAPVLHEAERFQRVGRHVVPVARAVVRVVPGHRLAHGGRRGGGAVAAAATLAAAAAAATVAAASAACGCGDRLLALWWCGAERPRGRLARNGDATAVAAQRAAPAAAAAAAAWAADSAAHLFAPHRHAAECAAVCCSSYNLSTPRCCTQPSAGDAERAARTPHDDDSRWPFARVEVTEAKDEEHSWPPRCAWPSVCNCACQRNAAAPLVGCAPAGLVRTNLSADCSTPRESILVGRTRRTTAWSATTGAQTSHQPLTASTYWVYRRARRCAACVLRASVRGREGGGGAIGCRQLLLDRAGEPGGRRSRREADEALTLIHTSPKRP